VLSPAKFIRTCITGLRVVDAKPICTESLIYSTPDIFY